MIRRRLSTHYLDTSCANDEAWIDGVKEGKLLGTYIANPDSSFRREDAEDKPQLLYESSDRLKESMWEDIKNNGWHYLSEPLYVSNF